MSFLSLWSSGHHVQVPRNTISAAFSVDVTCSRTSVRGMAGSLTVSDQRLASTHSLWASRLETAQTRVWCRVLSVLQLLWEDALPLNKQNKQKRSMRLHFWKELFIFSRAVYANWICAGRLESFWCKHMLYTSLLCLNCVSVLYEDFQQIAVFITVLGTLAVLLMLCMWL